MRGDTERQSSLLVNVTRGTNNVNREQNDLNTFRTYYKIEAE